MQPSSGCHPLPACLRLRIHPCLSSRSCPVLNLRAVWDGWLAGGVVFINRAAGNKLYLSLVHNVFNVTGEYVSCCALLALDFALNLFCFLLADHLRAGRGSALPWRVPLRFTFTADSFISECSHHDPRPSARRADQQHEAVHQGVRAGSRGHLVRAGRRQQLVRALCRLPPSARQRNVRTAIVFIPVLTLSAFRLLCTAACCLRAAAAARRLTPSSWSSSGSRCVPVFPVLSCPVCSRSCRAYILVRSYAYPEGEIRGQIAPPMPVRALSCASLDLSTLSSTRC